MDDATAQGDLAAPQPIVGNLEAAISKGLQFCKRNFAANLRCSTAELSRRDQWHRKPITLGTRENKNHDTRHSNQERLHQISDRGMAAITRRRAQPQLQLCHELIQIKNRRERCAT